MLRVIVGLLKGAVVGGAVGYGLLKLGWTSTFFTYVACSVVGALVGLVAGRPPWAAETFFTPLIKMIVGAAVGAGLCAIGLKVLPNPELTLGSLGTVSLHSGPALSLFIGMLYGLFVEVDDGGSSKPQPNKDAAQAEKK
jgi:hypothetical protein